ncbi:MAG: SemiSWEET transporter [Candidatus Woesearchaeota archaeon]|jgi:MtN3 and saliva related transmembrane protein|nr:SemiSWEET transporter [Candidatus Woesearchaeota archaeon]|tara:strand:+ start:507 stop:761 length:255 start_codon:yes stop_codon:yes gene_type:complete
MAYIDIIGFLAGTFTTIALMPQVVKAWKTKSTRDVSLIWAITLTIGVFLWLVYGILINSLPIVIANTMTFILSVIVLILKIRYK